MRTNLSVMVLVSVVILTIGAAAFRVTTAPERIRMRLESAKASCVGAGGQWVGEGRDAICRPVVAAER